jgi:hypothetical protein
VRCHESDRDDERSSEGQAKKCCHKPRQAITVHSPTQKPAIPVPLAVAFKNPIPMSASPNPSSIVSSPLNKPAIASHRAGR